jgi:DNA-binding phage protein
MRILEVKDLVPLLRAEVQRAGGVSAWSKKTGVNRTIVSKVLNDLRAPPKSMIKALKLRTVFVARKDWPKRPRLSR